MRKFLLVLIFCSSIYSAVSVWWGKGNADPIDLLGWRFVSTNELEIYYNIVDIMGNTIYYETNTVNYDGLVTIESTNQRPFIVTSNTVEYVYNGREIVVTSLTNKPVPRREWYRGYTYSNVLVIAVDWAMQPTNTPLGTTDVYTTESIQAAQLATNLWPGAHMLVLSSNIYQIVPYNYGTGGGDGYNYHINLPLFASNTPLALSWIPPTNYMIKAQTTNDPLFKNIMTHYVVPITNYLAAHKEIRFAGFSFGMPTSFKTTTGLYPDSDSVIHLLSFFSSPFALAGNPYPTNVLSLEEARSLRRGGCEIAADLTNGTQFFSFGCRTFCDTTNLLQWCSDFEFMHNDEHIVLDAVMNNPSTYTGLHPYVTTVLTNYYRGDDEKIILNDTVTWVTVTNLPIIGHCHWGIYTKRGVMGDNTTRSITMFTPIKASVLCSIQSYNFTSFRIGGPTEVAQERNYDAFMPTANQGNGYNRIFGCTIGHTREPSSGYYALDSVYKSAVYGYSFVDSFYRKDSYAPTISWIVCGHPFLRWTDFSEEGYEY